MYCLTWVAVEKYGAWTELVEMILGAVIVNQLVVVISTPKVCSAAGFISTATK